jgi:hypothetical protein
VVGSDSQAAGKSWQWHDMPTNFGETMPGNGGYWTTLEFIIPTDSDPTLLPSQIIPFYGGRLFVDYQGGQQDSFGWHITVTARPSLTE